jgi:hypothetical protein
MNRLARSNARIVGLNPTRGMGVCVYSVCVVLCVGKGHATAWSPFKESYRLRLKNWKRGQGSQGLYSHTQIVFSMNININEDSTSGFVWVWNCFLTFKEEPHGLSGFEKTVMRRIFEPGTEKWLEFGKHYITRSFITLKYLLLFYFLPCMGMKLDVS